MTNGIEESTMGVDVYHIKPMETEAKDFLRMAKNFLPDYMHEDIESNLGNRDWLMQFSTSYITWLHWIITASDEDPSRVGMVYPDKNTKYLCLLPHGHPWGSNGIYLRDEDCTALEKDLAWFMEEKMPNIVGCDYLKTKTELFFRAVQKVAESGGSLYIG